jgi:hypothetical protein
LDFYKLEGDPFFPGGSPQLFEDYRGQIKSLDFKKCEVHEYDTGIGAKREYGGGGQRLVVSIGEFVLLMPVLSMAGLENSCP